MENDVNGNGDATDAIPCLVVGTSSLDAQATLQGILGWWGLPTKDGASEYYCVVTDGEVDLAPRTEAYRAAITKIAEWYEKGYLWAEFYTGNTAAMASLLRESAIPVVGAFNSSAWDIANLEIYGDTDINNTKNDGVMKFVDPPAVEGYTARLFVNPAINGYRDCYAITNKCSEEDAKILLAWMDMAMFTLEGTVSADKGPADAEDRLDGFTNVWDWGEDGKPVLHAITEDQYWDNADLMSVFPDTVGSFYYLYVPEDYGEDGWMNMAMRLQEIRDGNHQWDNTELWPRPYYTEDVSIEISYLWPDIKSVITQYETQFIKGELEINDTNWNEYQKALYKAQIGRLVDLLQETYDATV